MPRTPLSVHLENFEGPLDLLLYLIQSHEMDISKISISKITDQYLEYIKLMQTLNFDIASEFLVMAATLIHWKSKALLPEDATATAQDVANEDEDLLTQENLIRQLLELQKFQKAGEELATLPLLGEDVFTRHASKLPVEKIWKEINLTELALSYQDTFLRSRKKIQILKKETVSLTQKIMQFSEKLEVGKWFELQNLIQDMTSRPETVVTFLAALELSRLKKIKLHQQKIYEVIYLELMENIKYFDLAQASGFEPESIKEQSL
ncbi:MAG: segregation/condensation protein A [Bdellovibrio sp.]|nr:segregation/condensation protein A [Bdellovibrio sp.]